MQYDELTYTRHEIVDGESDWIWINTDTGAWDGPKHDWETSHKQKILKYVKDFRCVVQAGGNQGMYPRLLSNLFKTVYTFEPDYLNFYCLARNCQKSNIIKIQSALGVNTDFINIAIIDDKNVGMNKVDSTRVGIIPQLALDTFSFNCVDLLMLDVEGYEENVLHGAFNTLEQFRPVIFCENSNDRIQELLGDLNYELVDVSMADSIYVQKS